MSLIKGLLEDNKATIVKATKNRLFIFINAYNPYLDTTVSETHIVKNCPWEVVQFIEDIKGE